MASFNLAGFSTHQSALIRQFSFNCVSFHLNFLFTSFHSVASFYPASFDLLVRFHLLASFYLLVFHSLLSFHKVASFYFTGFSLTDQLSLSSQLLLRQFFTCQPTLISFHSVASFYSASFDLLVSFHLLAFFVFYGNHSLCSQLILTSFSPLSRLVSFYL